MYVPQSGDFVRPVAYFRLRIEHQPGAARLFNKFYGMPTEGREALVERPKKEATIRLKQKPLKSFETDLQSELSAMFDLPKGQRDSEEKRIKGCGEVGGDG